MTKKILVAKVVSVFGIKGAVKIISYCDNPIQIEKYPLFDAKGNSLKLKISNKNKTIVGLNSSGDAILIAEIEGVTDRNQAETLRGIEIFTNRQDLKKTAKDEFYYVDLIGLNVIDETSQKIGKVLNVNNFGAGGMLEIEFEENFHKKNSAKNLEKIENFPFSSKIFPDVNLDEGTVLFVMPEILKE